MTDDRATYRILDAASNRAFEALRTLEEFARFIRDDRQQASSLKRLRHELAESVALLDREKLLGSRDTSGDVGAAVEGSLEYQRTHYGDIIAAAAQRLQQALRCLEEYGKLYSTEFSKRIEALRYRAYDLCAGVELVARHDDRRHRLARSRLYLLCDVCPDPNSFVQRLEQCVRGGVDVIQLRDRSCSDRELYERACLAKQVLQSTDVLLIINDRIDIAVASGADGVHVGQDELPAHAVRKVASPSMLIGISTHSVEQAIQAERDGADYIGVGPVFPSQTKAFETFVGPQLVEAVRREVTVPAFAIGGITLDNLHQITSVGHDRVAVSGAIIHSHDIESTGRAFQSQLIGSRAS